MSRDVARDAQPSRKALAGRLRIAEVAEHLVRSARSSRPSGIDERALERRGVDDLAPRRRGRGRPTVPGRWRADALAASYVRRFTETIGAISVHP